MSNDSLPFPDVEGDAKKLIDIFGKHITKDEILKVAKDRYKTIVNEGFTDPLSAFLQAKVITEYCSELGKLLHESAYNEAGKYGKEDNHIMGITFDQTSTPTKRDYSIDNEWSDLQKTIDECKAAQKEREALMKKAIGLQGVTDDDGVEINEPPIKSGGKQIVKVTIARSLKK
jgi:hypothetical protein